MNARKIGALLCLALVAAPLSAAVLDPDDYPPGTDISQAVPGVTLSTVNSDLGDPRVIALVPARAYWASTGDLVFGHAGDYAEHWVTDTVTPYRRGALRADFSPPAVAVSLDIIGNDLSDCGLLAAYDAGGALLQLLATDELSAGEVQTLSVAGVGDISYIVAGGVLADTVCLDRLTYFVPEPGTATGLVALCLCRRRRA